jgi:hypothetical protein
LAALLGVGNTLASIYTIGELHAIKASVSDLQQEEDYVLDIVQSHEIRLATFEKKEAILEEITKKTLMTFKTSSLLISSLMFYIQFEYKISLVKQNVDGYQDVINGIMSRRLPTAIVNFANMTTVLRNVTAKVEERGFHLIPQSIDHIFQVEVSYLTEGRKVHILAHLPIARTENILTLYKYLPTPIPLADRAVTMKINDFHDVLAISNSFFLTMKFYDLASCKVMGKTYLCQNQNVLTKTKFLDTTCLGSLHKSDATKVVENCPHTFHAPQDEIYQLSKTKFSSFSTKEQNLDVNCIKKSKSGIWVKDYPDTRVINGQQKIELGTNCIAESDKHMFGTDINVESENSYLIFERSFQNPYKKFDFFDQELKEMAIEYNSLSEVVPSNVRNLKAEFAHQRNTHHLYNAIYIAAGVGTAFVLALVYFGYLYVKVKMSVSEVRVIAETPNVSTAPPKYKNIKRVPHINK